MRLISGLKRWFMFVALFVCLWSVPARAQEEDPGLLAKSLAAYTTGVIYDLYGLTEDAIAQFEQAVSFSDNYLIHLRLGADYARLGQLEEAIKEEQKVLAADPENVQARYLLALIYSTQKKFDEAAQQYEVILTSFAKAEPENLAVYGYLGQLYYAQKEFDKAISQFEIILSLNPQDTDVLFLLGSLYLEVEKEDRAIEMFARAIKLNPDDSLSLNSLGYVYAEQGVKLDEAQQLIEQALAIEPKNGAYLDSLGWVYYKKGEFDQALKYLQQADSYISDPVIYEHIGDVYFKMEKIEDARRYWELSLKMAPGQQQILKKLDSLR